MVRATSVDFLRKTLRELRIDGGRTLRILCKGKAQIAVRVTESEPGRQ